MKMDRKDRVRILIITAIILLCINYWGAIEKLLVKFISALSPVIIGFVISYVLNILMSFYERHYFTKKASLKVVSKTKRPVCLTGAILTLAVVVSFVMFLVVPELAACVKLLVSEIPPAMEKLMQSEFVTNVLPKNVAEVLNSIDWKQNIVNIANVITSGIGNAAEVVVSAVTSVFSVVATVFLSIIFAVYLLLGKEKISRQAKLLIKSYLPEKYRKKIVHILDTADECFHRYIVGQCTEAVVLGVLCMIGMTIFRFPYAVMIGALIGLTALIPIAGAYIGALVGAVMILTVSPLKSVLFLVFIVVLQQLEGNLIYPKVVGKSIGLPAIYVLMAITVGGGLYGITGMLIGVPIAATIYRLVGEDIRKKG